MTSVISYHLQTTSFDEVLLMPHHPLFFVSVVREHDNNVVEIQWYCFFYSLFFSFPLSKYKMCHLICFQNGFFYCYLFCVFNFFDWFFFFSIYPPYLDSFNFYIKYGRHCFNCCLNFVFNIISKHLILDIFISDLFLIF